MEAVPLYGVSYTPIPSVTLQLCHNIMVLAARGAKAMPMELRLHPLTWWLGKRKRTSSMQLKCDQQTYIYTYKQTQPESATELDASR